MNALGKLIVSVLVLVLMLSNCSEKKVQEVEPDNNPAAEGFNMSASDPEAVEIADRVMLAMGGRKNWDNTHYVCWEFFGRRHLIWDKWSGDVRIESFRDSIQYILNVNHIITNAINIVRNII